MAWQERARGGGGEEVGVVFTRRSKLSTPSLNVVHTKIRPVMSKTSRKCDDGSQAQERGRESEARMKYEKVKQASMRYRSMVF